ncbi:MAG: cobalt ECF transporter T component CbiQ [Desulfosoma sp.]
MNPILIRWQWVAAGLVGSAAVFAAAWFYGHVARRRKLSRCEASTEWEVDSPLPELDVEGTHRSFFHHWDPRLKILSLFFFAFMTVSLQHWTGLLICLTIATGSILAARTPMHRARQRLAAISGFLFMLALIMPLTVPFHEGDRHVVLEGLPSVALNLRGLDLAARIGTKAVIVALMMEPLLRTTPFPVTVAALRRLGVPVILCQMLLLMYRYVFVFRHEMQRMWVGMTVRGFGGRTGMETFRDLGCFLGMLFVRSMERTQRVYEAMLCRGYTGTFPSTVRFAAKPKDWIWALTWTAVSLGVFLGDRWLG